MSTEMDSLMAVSQLLSIVIGPDFLRRQTVTAGLWESGTSRQDLQTMELLKHKFKLGLAWISCQWITLISGCTGGTIFVHTICSIWYLYGVWYPAVNSLYQYLYSYKLLTRLRRSIMSLSQRPTRVNIISRNLWSNHFNFIPFIIVKRFPVKYIHALDTFIIYRLTEVIDKFSCWKNVVIAKILLRAEDESLWVNDSQSQRWL